MLDLDLTVGIAGTTNYWPLGLAALLFFFIMAVAIYVAIRRERNKPCPVYHKMDGTVDEDTLGCC